jgi:hypothetical protein
VKKYNIPDVREYVKAFNQGKGLSEIFKAEADAENAAKQHAKQRREQGKTEGVSGGLWGFLGANGKAAY